MKTYFITGANGLVGSYLAREIIDKGYGKVVALKRETSNLAQLGAYAEQIDWVVGDLLEVDGLENGIARADYVIHSAAAVSMDRGQKDRIRQVNIDGTANVVNLCLAKGDVELLHISSIAAIGREKGKTTLDENNQWEEDESLPEYTLSKYLAELEVWRGIAEGLPAVIVNPSVVLGVGNWRQSSLQMFDFLAKGSVFYPMGKLNYVDVRDVAELSLALLHKNIRGERFILNGGSRPYRDVLIDIANKIGAKPPSRPLTPTLGKLLSRADALRAMLTGSSRKITGDLIKSTSHQLFFNNQKATDRLGVPFRPLEETLAWAASAYNNDRHVK